MPSTLSWIDHDTAERERMQRVLSLFQEAGTVDQLGLGGIRDAIADRLFPGTSTIQSRLRYFLFIPWIYRQIENEAVPSRRVAALARERELELIEPLRASGDDGVLGRDARSTLKVLPSQIYWNGLRLWGIRSFNGSRAAYHRALDEVYTKRRQAAHADEANEDSHGWVTWHPALPEPPVEFPEKADMNLTRGEADFLQARILAEHPRSLLALLAKGGEPTNVAFPWQHPRYAEFSDLHKLLLHHGRLFSELRFGAAVLYNLVVARAANRTELVEEHTATLRKWREQLNRDEMDRWDLDELWELTLNQGHTISPATRRFVGEWLTMALGIADPATDAVATALVRDRERRLKGNRSKFENAIALEEKWSGRDGIGRLEYRWSYVQSHLNDLYAGLSA